MGCCTVAELDCCLVVEWNQWSITESDRYYIVQLQNHVSYNVWSRNLQGHHSNSCGHTSDRGNWKLIKPESSMPINCKPEWLSASHCTQGERCGQGDVPEYLWLFLASNPNFDPIRNSAADEARKRSWRLPPKYQSVEIEWCRLWKRWHQNNTPIPPWLNCCQQGRRLRV